MAKMRGGASSGLLWSTVIFVFGFMICLILAIMFYTRIKEAEAGKVAAEEALVRFATPEEQRGDLIRGMVQTSERSVVGQLLDEGNMLKRFIIGSPQASVEAIQSRMVELGLTDGGFLIREVTRLRAEESAAKELEQQLDQKYRQADQRATAAETAKKQVEDKFAEETKKLQSQMATLQKDADAYRADVEKQRETLTQQLAQVRAQMQERRATDESRIAQLEAEVASLQLQIRRTTAAAPSRRLGGIDPSLAIDGRITAIMRERQLVYISLGRKDRLITGITFEVYDRRTGVVTNPQGEFRGKATVEVVNVYETYSVARIVRIETGQELFEEDVIANAIYDPNMRLEFFVHGTFDIDNIGQPTVSDRHRIENMISSWGGVLASGRERGPAGLTYDVDFLVLGQEPERPEILPDTEVDPERIERQARLMQQYQSYYDLVTEATRLSIPILNQNRFLVMVGYYQR